jgi:N-hydroxyarylamine O-acetyltransferase
MAPAMNRRAVPVGSQRRNRTGAADGLPAVDVDAYLARIGYAGPRRVDADTLSALHRAHMLAVPFENLDIHRGRGHALEPERSLAKIVDRRRGGWCFELNGAFAVLLRALGFPVTLLGAAVHAADGLTPELAHLTLRIDLERPWLADVGFGDSFTRPLRLDEPGEQVRDGRPFRLDRAGDRVTLVDAGRPAYTFTLEPRVMEDFADMSRRLQTEPRWVFVQRRICSLATERGRLSLSDLRLIETVDGERLERELADEAEWRAVLRERFGVEPDG